MPDSIPPPRALPTGITSSMVTGTESSWIAGNLSSRGRLVKPIPMLRESKREREKCDVRPVTELLI